MANHRSRSAYNLVGYAGVIAKRLRSLKMVDDTTEPRHDEDGTEASFKIIDRNGGIVLVRVSVYKEPING